MCTREDGSLFVLLLLYTNGVVMEKIGKIKYEYRLLP